MMDKASIADGSCGVCDMQVSLMRKPFHWSKLSLSSVKGSVFHMTETDMVFNMENLGDSFRVSPNPMPPSDL